MRYLARQDVCEEERLKAHLFESHSWNIQMTTGQPVLWIVVRKLLRKICDVL